MVALARTSTAAVRMPAMITGRARGSCTCQAMFSEAMPMPRADFDDGGIHAREAGLRVDEDRRDGQDSQGDHGGQETDPDQGQHYGHDRQAGDGTQRADYVGDPGRSSLTAVRQHPKCDADHNADEQSDRA